MNAIFLFNPLENVLVQDPHGDPLWTPLGRVQIGQRIGLRSGSAGVWATLISMRMAGSTLHVEVLLDEDWLLSTEGPVRVVRQSDPIPNPNPVVLKRRTLWERLDEES